ncbi:aldo/keto reductase [Mucilaginibacter arboris]|uniref:Aldo/keto reductase n=1 Tax=Mucilaginibacter arboris TaxID=2682090 RepID=A0A7K1STQ1_9SPHI|nr:aldo/keto reductase [Mucilaginibacter arboris]MVN20664.1 aldo/keto reductase [Mucilaginibacter arboris]
MKYATLGKSDLSVSKIGFGCMSLRGSSEENKTLLNKALELGINYFDTADLYDGGQNEIIIGNLLKFYRDKIVLATKVGNQRQADGSTKWNASKAYILQAVEGSLKRLQTDYIDLYQLHGGMIDDNIDETIEAFELLKQQGKIRYYGISSIRPNVIREYVAKSNIVSVMMQYSLLDRRPKETCFNLLEKNQISCLTRGSVAQGLLVNKPAKAYLNYSEKEVLKAAQAIKEVSDESKSNAQTALQFALAPKIVASAVVGIRTLEQLEDAVGTLDVPELSDEDLNLLKNSIIPNQYEQHR